MTIARCTECPWEVDFAGGLTAAEAGLGRHVQLRHPHAVPGGDIPAQPARVERVPQLANVDWWTRAVDAIAAQPAGAQFTLYEVCGHLDEPPTSNGWQQLARDAHHLGLVEDVGGVNSKRPGTKGSKTTLWRRTARRHDRTGRRTA